MFNVQESDVKLVVINVDHFKLFNDRYIHSAGHKTLQVIAKVLQHAVSQSDFIPRNGGEKFVLLMPGIILDNASIPLEKLCKGIKNIPFKFKDTQVQITI